VMEDINLHDVNGEITAYGSLLSQGRH
jgi:hypothetical protein